MIIERVLQAPKPVSDRDMLRDLANDALLQAQAKAAEAEAARLQAVRDKEDAIRDIGRQRDDANAAKDAATAELIAVRDQVYTMTVRYEDAESARIAAVSGLEIERAAHEQTKGILVEERAGRLRDESRLSSVLGKINSSSDGQPANYEIRVTGRDDLGRLLALKLTKEKP